MAEFIFNLFIWEPKYFAIKPVQGQGKVSLKNNPLCLRRRMDLMTRNITDSMSSGNRTWFLLYLSTRISLEKLYFETRYGGQSPRTGQVVVSSAEIQDDAQFPFFFLLKCIRIVPVKAIAVCAWVYTGTYCTLFFCESNAGQFESANIYFTDYHGDHFNQLWDLLML